MNKARLARIGAWSLSTVAAMLAIARWWQDYGTGFRFNSYIIFPVLGLVAYSIMWSHYMAGAAGQLLHLDKKVLANYFRWTGYMVLALICLHPGLLIYQRFIDGRGLPPHSYETYVAPGLGWITILGTASLLVFLAFEFHRKYSDRSWWHFVPEAGDFAMLAIFYHSLRLGSDLQQGWFRYVWWFYGVTLTVVIVRSYIVKYALKKSATAS